ncbi:MAG: PDR/VanB family oxidoreductase [Burkholderiales bacterium]
MSEVEAPFQVRLRQIRLEADGILSFELVSPEGAALPPFTAGGHIDVLMPDAMVRSYSLANAPSDTHRYLIAVARDAESRGGSVWMHDVPRVGDLLTIHPPRNLFPLNEAAPHTIFIGGGIGITPLMAMIARLQALGRSWQLHYAARSPQQAAFADELRARGEPVHFQFLSETPALLDLDRIVREAPAGTHLYCCGPAGMIDAYIKAGAQRPAEFIHFERFAAAQAAATEGGFDIVLARSDRRFTVEAGKTILDVLLDNGINVQYACSEGICGTCRIGVLEGQPDHRDDYLTDEEKAANQSIMVCCSGSRSERLVLDL